MRQTISTSSQACHHIILDTAQGLGDPVMSAGASSIGLVLNSQNFWTEGSDLERTWESQIPQPPPPPFPWGHSASSDKKELLYI